ncbi:hypothetical protein DFJ73DRAFT_962751 [Zopfochytrium polystomum]|nr:hypothetical protein DFJ73DRAFT_962751 [Zopfochytrium polystomum]
MSFGLSLLASPAPGNPLFVIEICLFYRYDKVCNLLGSPSLASFPLFILYQFCSPALFLCFVSPPPFFMFTTLFFGFFVRHGLCVCVCVCVLSFLFLFFLSFVSLLLWFVCCCGLTRRSTHTSGGGRLHYSPPLHPALQVTYYGQLSGLFFALPAAWVVLVGSSTPDPIRMG